MRKSSKTRHSNYSHTPPPTNLAARRSGEIKGIVKTGYLHVITKQDNDLKDEKKKFFFKLTEKHWLYYATHASKINVVGQYINIPAMYTHVHEDVEENTFYLDDKNDHSVPPLYLAAKNQHQKEEWMNVLRFSLRSRREKSPINNSFVKAEASKFQEILGNTLAAPLYFPKFDFRMVNSLYVKVVEAKNIKTKTVIKGEKILPVLTTNCFYCTVDLEQESHKTNVVFDSKRNPLWLQEFNLLSNFSYHQLLSLIHI
eukprot:TRINITY_DN6298_c0_g1_i1.p1 TRINITY_DN6298_c0_g1~~TRINITY_DN6298_c0_g1_i1.p1  ORF type:complete len:256 (+),score=34.85 TRINITY_DN6298_c0_g1_i1:31-798(+)